MKGRVWQLEKFLIKIIASIFGMAIIACWFMRFVSSWVAILCSFLIMSFALLVFIPEDNKFEIARHSIGEEQKNKSKKSSKEISFIRRIQAKLRLLTIRKKWQKSSHSRHIPAMARKLKKWAKTNPDIASVISVVLSQMKDLATATCIFEEVLKDSEFGYKGRGSRRAFEFTVSQIRQNFSDICNLLILAGANQGKATTKTLDQIALARELNSNRIKLELLNNLNAEVVQLVNQVDTAYDNAMMEAEIETLSQMNAARLGAQPSPMEHLKTESAPAATASQATNSQTS